MAKVTEMKNDDRFDTVVKMLNDFDKDAFFYQPRLNPRLLMYEGLFCPDWAISKIISLGLTLIICRFPYYELSGVKLIIFDPK